MRSPRASVKRWWPLALDLVCVVAFAAGGKSAHDESATWWVIARIAWPYLVAYLVACLLGWLVVLRRGWDPPRWRPAGITVLASTYVLGMALRLLSGRGIALGFLLVAICFLTLTLLGWRGVAALARRRTTG